MLRVFDLNVTSHESFHNEIDLKNVNHENLIKFIGTLHSKSELTLIIITEHFEV